MKKITRQQQAVLERACVVLRSLSNDKSKTWAHAANPEYALGAIEGFLGREGYVKRAK